jgi:hypothetical protein
LTFDLQAALVAAEQRVDDGVLDDAVDQILGGGIGFVGHCALQPTQCSPHASLRGRRYPARIS